MGNKISDWFCSWLPEMQNLECGGKLMGVITMDGDHLWWRLMQMNQN
jgi:hypothetical protein